MLVFQSQQFHKIVNLNMMLFHQKKIQKHKQFVAKKTVLNPDEAIQINLNCHYLFNFRLFLPTINEKEFPLC